MIQVVVNQTSTGLPHKEGPTLQCVVAEQNLTHLERCTGSLGTWHHHKERLWRNWELVGGQGLWSIHRGKRGTTSSLRSVQLETSKGESHGLRWINKVREYWAFVP